MLPDVFRPFVEQRPIAVMARAALERLFDPQRLDALFAATARRQYTRQLLFSAVVDLMASVVWGTFPSVHAAFRAKRAHLPVSDQSIYNKLDRLELGVTAALVADAAAQVAPVIDALGARLAPWLPGYRARLLDGNLLSATEHRLAALRTTWAAPGPAGSSW